MKAILRWTVATYLFYASTLAFAGNLPGRTGTSFWVGYNEAWFGQNYLNSLASNPYFYPGLPSSSTFDPTFVDTMFAGMASGGAKIVRIWVFPAVQGIKLDTSKTNTLGITDDLIGNSAKGIVSNLQTVFTLARHHGLKVYVTALNGNDMKVADTNGLRPYFSNLLTNTSERDAFKTKALLPLLNLLNLNSDVIYAFDLINEIEAPVIANYFPMPIRGARDFIQDMTAFVKSNSSLRVTSSAGGAGGGLAAFEIISGLFSGLGLDFYDVHVYADGGVLPSVTELCNKVSADGVQIILGEYGQKTQSTNDILQSLTTANFLSTAKTTCFSAALAWMYEINVIPTQVFYLTYLRPDGTFRPAYYVIQSFGTRAFQPPVASQ